MRVSARVWVLVNSSLSSYCFASALMRVTRFILWLSCVGWWFEVSGLSAELHANDSNTFYDCSSISFAVPWTSSDSSRRVVARVLRLVNWSLFLHSVASDLMRVLINVSVRLLWFICGC